MDNRTGSNTPFITLGTLSGVNITSVQTASMLLSQKERDEQMKRFIESIVNEKIKELKEQLRDEIRNEIKSEISREYIKRNELSKRGCSDCDDWEHLKS